MKKISLFILGILISINFANAQQSSNKKLNSDISINELLSPKGMELAAVELRKAQVEMYKNMTFELEKGQEIEKHKKRFNKSVENAAKIIDKMPLGEQINMKAQKLEEQASSRARQEVIEVQRLMNLENNQMSSVNKFRSSLKQQVYSDGKSRKNNIIIQCEGGTHLDTKEKIAIFMKTNKANDHVRLKHPQFDLICDKLTVYLSKESTDGGIEKAVAEGYVEIFKIAENGDEEIAVARYVEFFAKTGKLRLTGFPMLQKGKHMLKGTKEGTIIEIDEKGRLKTYGPSRTFIIPNKKKKLKKTKRKSLF